MLARPEPAIRQFPPETHRRCACTVAALGHDLAGSGRVGRVGRWLWTGFLELPLPDWIRLGGVWPLGDSPAVLVTALDDESSTYTETAGGTRRVHTDVDTRLLFGDLPARLRLHEARQAGVEGAPPHR
ncbi:hypothetical protein ACI798_21455 [Geodermatophilus sp. SYSU D01045]